MVPLALLVAMPCVDLGGCNDTSALAPTSPATPWRIDVEQGEQTPTVVQDTARLSDRPTGRVRVFALPKSGAVPVPPPPGLAETTHPYTLAELIDLAQTRNKGTRVAWEQARQAAIQVGISQAALLPELTVDALGGYTRSASPFPNLLVRRGYITSNAESVFPEAVIKYLLLDFGGRRAIIATARDLSFASNVGFTAVHQKLIMDVARSYFLLSGWEAQLAAARAAEANARLLETAALARLARGEGTVTDAAIPRRGTAQASVSVPETQTAVVAARLTIQ